jgi:hypothetical protein
MGISRGAPSDTQLYIVILQGHQGKGRLPVLTEGEAKGVELGSRASIIQGTRHRLGLCSGREGGGDESGIRGILGVDNLTTDEKFNLGNQKSPIWDDLRVGTGRIMGRQVNIVEEITLALETNGGHTTVVHVTLDDLTFNSLGKIRVTFVRGPEERDLGLANEVSILGTDSY